MTLRKIVLVYCLVSEMILLGVCSVTLEREPTLSPTYVEFPYSDLDLEPDNANAYGQQGTSNMSTL
jgi:hypothetical protein